MLEVSTVLDAARLIKELLLPLCPCKETPGSAESGTVSWACLYPLSVETFIDDHTITDRNRACRIFFVSIARSSSIGIKISGAGQICSYILEEECEQKASAVCHQS